VRQRKSQHHWDKNESPSRFAALANGISIHADDYDDTGSALHVAAPVLPPVFALCESGNRSGKDLMLAFHVGVEVENRSVTRRRPATKERAITRRALAEFSAARRRPQNFAA